MSDLVTEDDNYGPPKFFYISVGVFSISLVGVLGFLMYNSDKREADFKLEKARIEKGYFLQERDLNGNGILEKFYTVDGKIAVIELDGKPLFPSLDTKVLEKEK